MTAERLQHRQGPVEMRDGVPYANPATTLSLLPGAAMGQWLAKHSDNIRGDMLDLGCGNQPYRSWYEPLATSVTALDAAPMPGVDVVAFADDVPLPDGSFDTILATEVLEHVGDAERAMSEIVRLLRPGGVTLITTPFIVPVHEAPYDYRRFTHFGLIGMAERHGLSVEDIASKGGAAALVGHTAVMFVVESSERVWRKLGGSRPPIEYRTFRRALVASQERVIRRRPMHRPVGGGSARVSIGYMMLCRKPTF